MSEITNLLTHIGNKIQNYSYLLDNPSYSQVRAGKGCGELYRLLNKDWFPRKSIQTVLDVGANEGQFIKTSLALLPNASIYSFEPNPYVVSKLKTTDFGSDKIEILPVALGSKKTTLPLHISKFSPSSSFFTINEQCIKEFPGTEVEGVINVEVNRLDDIAQSLAIENHCLLKIDVQGFELEVLLGATEIFNRIDVIVCEVNLAPLYEGQCTFEDIVSFLRKYNYRLVDIGTPVYSRNTQEALYLDLAFKKYDY